MNFAWPRKRRCFSATGKNADHFFVGELADTINNLLQGRHELRSVTDKKAGMLLRELGIPSRRMAKGFKVSLTQAVREQIQAVARAYLAASVVDGVMRCSYSPAQSVKDRSLVCTSCMYER